MLNRRNRQSGDSIIEVLFAVAIFSLIMVGSVALMNQGTSASRRALEITLVREQIDGQAETLRYLHDAYMAAPDTAASMSTPAGRWASLMGKVSTANATNFDAITTTCPEAPTGKRFVMNPAQSTFTSAAGVFQKADGYARVEQNPADGTITKASGIWVEAVKSKAAIDKIGYTDFHIRACWAGPGTNAALKIGTIVRLYDRRP
jgi:type II secretory pathway pseudopilin PulG